MIQRYAPAGVIERWQPELDALAPRSSSGFSHLMLVWEPGEEWCPVERWVIYEMHPAHRAPMGMYEELRGPNPRGLGYFDYYAQRFIRDRHAGINMRTWLLYRETGFFGRPIWIVQGRYGGHKRWWSDVEENLARMHSDGVVTEPPGIGDLEYAEPDDRTIAKLAGMDMVKKYGDLLGHLSDDNARAQAIRDGLDFRERAVAQEMARQVWEWLDEQVEEAFEENLSRKVAQDIWDGAADDYDYVQPDIAMEEEASVDEIVRSFT